MKHMNLRTISTAALCLAGTVLTLSAFAQPPQGAYGPGYGSGSGYGSQSN